jgi:hypothetical protein
MVRIAMALATMAMLAVAACETDSGGGGEADAKISPDAIPSEVPSNPDVPVEEVPVTPDAAEETPVAQDVPVAQEVPVAQDVAADVPGGPSGHTEDMGGGAWHKPGKDDPLKNCVSCHGAKLDGGAAGVSCYSCHNNNDHTKSQGGFKHKSGTKETCKACHGPNNNGGLGPASSSCHN